MISETELRVAGAIRASRGPSICYCSSPGEPVYVLGDVVLAAWNGGRNRKIWSGTWAVVDREWLRRPHCGSCIPFSPRLIEDLADLWESPKYMEMFL